MQKSLSISSKISQILILLQDITLFVCLGNDKEGPCQFVLQGSENVVKDLGPKIMEILEAKGGGKGTRLNGKFTSLKNYGQVEQLMKDYFKWPNKTCFHLIFSIVQDGPVAGHDLQIFGPGKIGGNFTF